MTTDGLRAAFRAFWLSAGVVMGLTITNSILAAFIYAERDPELLADVTGITLAMMVWGTTLGAFFLGGVIAWHMHKVNPLEWWIRRQA